MFYENKKVFLIKTFFEIKFFFFGLPWNGLFSTSQLFLQTIVLNQDILIKLNNFYSSACLNLPYGAAKQ